MSKKLKNIFNLDRYSIVASTLILSFVLMYSCNNEGEGNIIVKLPNSFRGQGALIFEEDDNCQKTQRDMVVFPNNKGFVVVPNKRCMIMNNIDRRYRFEMLDSTGKYQQICPISYLGGCHTIDCNTFNNLYMTGSSTVTMNSKKIVLFHVGRCDEPDSSLYLNSPESRRFREMLDDVTSKMN